MDSPKPPRATATPPSQPGRPATTLPRPGPRSSGVIPPRSQPERNAGPNIAPNFVRLGNHRAVLRDIYHYLLVAPWSRLLPLIAVTYVAANSLFAGAFLACGDCIENARPGSFTDAFFFSVQTMCTIGYGRMLPRGMLADSIVAIEALCGVVGMAMITGLMFAKLARPSARVLFSKNMVVMNRDGKPCLVFRMANARSNNIVEAQVKAVLLRTEVTAEGEQMRRFYDVRLERSQTPLFAISFTAIHIIDETSLLYGHDRESLDAVNAVILVVFTGFDESFAQTVHARQYYLPEDILWNHRFVDIMSRLPDGRGTIDYRLFHDTEPLPPPPKETQD